VKWAALANRTHPKREPMAYPVAHLTTGLDTGSAVTTQVPRLVLVWRRHLITSCHPCAKFRVTENQTLFSKPVTSTFARSEALEPPTF
jgi:hypothetical protein